MSVVQTPPIELNRWETQNVDLANKVKGNHYLRHVDHRSTQIPTNRIFEIHVRLDI